MLAEDKLSYFVDWASFCWVPPCQTLFLLFNVTYMILKQQNRREVMIFFELIFLIWLCYD